MFEPTNATRAAIECLTLWMEHGDAARLNAAEHIFNVTRDPDGPGVDHLVAGLLNLGMILVLELAKEQGAADIAQRAGEILRSLAVDFPE